MSGEEQQPLTAAGDAPPPQPPPPPPSQPAGGTSGETPAAAATAAAASERSKDDVRSLMVFQAVLYMNKYYVGLFWLCQVLMFVWKGENLPFADGILVSEVILLFVICGLDLARIGLSMHGNLTENRVSLALAIGFAIPPVIGSVYLILWQTYTLMAEVVTCSLALIFHGAGILLAIASLATIS